MINKTNLKLYLKEIGFKDKALIKYTKTSTPTLTFSAPSRFSLKKKFFFYELL